MKKLIAVISFVAIMVCLTSCSNSPSSNKETNSYQSSTDTELAEYINKIRAVDNHAHANTIDPGDKGSDALPLDGLGNIELPARVRPESQTWIDAAKTLYGITDTVLNEKAMKNLADSEQN